jgi:hypothetical protein
LSAKGHRLTDVVKGKIFRGVVTGLNEVFVITQEQRDRLVGADPKSIELIKPFAQGTHLRPWYIEPSGEFLIFTRRGTPIEDYPSIRAYFEQFKKHLEPKPDDWQGTEKWSGRKPGPYQWYEIQDSVDYWPALEETKIVWPDICKLPRFSLDRGKRFLGNTAFCIPTDDFYLLGVLNSWATWFFLSKTAQPLRLRGDRWQYRLFTQFTENIPIPEASDADRALIAGLAELCSSLGVRRFETESGVQNRLTQVFGFDAKGQPLGKLNEKAQEWWEQPLQVLGLALKQSFKLKRNPFANPKAADGWETYLQEKKAAVGSLRRKLADAEAKINECVYRAFDLNPEEIRLLQLEVEH